MGDEGGLGHISKGHVNTQVDAYANSNQRQNFLAALQSTRDFLDILQNDAGVLSRYIQYLRRTWYNQGVNGWWLSLQPIQPLVRQGIIQAIELASRDPDTNVPRNLTIDSYWLPIGSQVETLLAVSGQQVIRLLVTPPTPVPPTRSRTIRVPIWIVKNSGSQTPGTHTFEEVVVAVQNNITIWRRKEFQ